MRVVQLSSGLHIRFHGAAISEVPDSIPGRMDVYGTVDVAYFHNTSASVLPK